MSAATTAHFFDATIIRTTRRAVNIVDNDRQTFDAFNPPKSLGITVGDGVRCQRNGRDIVITEVLPRKNCLKRAVPEREKRLAANLDHLFIVTAAPPLFNSTFIDRIAAAATIEEIPYTLIVNKADLGCTFDDFPFLAYKQISCSMLLTSAKDGTGLTALREMLSAPSFRKVAFAGVSGVGKSSIINILIPDAASKVSDISRKTGQGKQTTSSGFAHVYPRSTADFLFVIDLPGIQHYGCCHLSESELRQAFPEIRDAAALCQFDDCTHTAEPGCEVKKRIFEGAIPASRYESYVDILGEIKRAKAY